MSWKTFEEFKTFAATGDSHQKRYQRRGWPQPTKKRKKSTSDASFTFDATQESIDGFSSEEEEEREIQKRSPDREEQQERTVLIARKSKVASRQYKMDRTDEDGFLDELLHVYDSDHSLGDENTESCAKCPVTAVEAASSKDERQTHSTIGMISEFDSSDEEHSKESEVVDIENPTPSPSLNHTPRQAGIAVLGTPRTGSEWLKQLHPHTSPQSQDLAVSPEGKAGIDSAKKKKKFKRSGFAEQLQRLISREKSEKTFWSHKLIDQNRTEQKSLGEGRSAITVQVLSTHMQYSLHLTRCCIMPDDEDINNLPVIVDVVFNSETYRQLTCRVGAVIRIHPPWQKLEIPDSPYSVLLCTYFCERLPTPPGSPMVDVKSLPGPHAFNSKRTEASTSCLSKSPMKSFHPTKLQFGEEGKLASCSGEKSRDVTPNRLITVGTSRDETSEVKHVMSIMAAIEAQGGCSGGDVAFHAVVQRIYRRRVRIAREMTPESTTTCHYIPAKGPVITHEIKYFTGDKCSSSPSHSCLSKTVITRARSAEDKDEVRWTLLLQDTDRTFCEVQIPVELLLCNASWYSCVHRGEGKSFVFSNLRVVQRTNRTRSPGLFSLMDSLWKTADVTPSPKDPCSQILSSEDNSSPAKHPRSAPSYCYVLTMHGSSRVVELDEEHHHLESLYKPPFLSDIDELANYDDVKSQRFTVWCRVLCSRPTTPPTAAGLGQGHQRWTGVQLFVTDASLHRSCSTTSQGSQKRYFQVDVRASHGVLDSVKEAVTKTGSVLYLKDVACHYSGVRSVHADSYTVIKKGLPDPSHADTEKGEVECIPRDVYTDLMSITLQDSLYSLAMNSMTGTLCSVMGVVRGVDEESACCWLVCTVCGSSDLVEKSGLPYYCSVCQKDVLAPLTKTHLEVFMTCDSCKEANVRVKLLQSTVERLLPVSYQESEQGYDIECVLGKRLDPLCCYIEHASGKNITLEEIAMAM